MNIIVRANEEKVKEEKGMCEAIIDLFREEDDAGIKAATEAATQEVMEHGRQQGMEGGMEQGLQRGILQSLLCSNY